MKLAPKRRTFWKYNKDNWAIFVVWGYCIGLGIASLCLGSLGFGAFFFGVGLLTLFASWIDWKRKG